MLVMAYKLRKKRSMKKRQIFIDSPLNLGFIGSLLVVFKECKVSHPVIEKSRPMSEFGQVTVTTKLSQLS